MTRREIREHLIKMLYCSEFHDKADMNEQMDMYFSWIEPSQKDREYIDERFGSIVSKLEDIDAIISEKCVGWKISRIGKVDLSILRLAVYEIRVDEQVPDKVAINEAVELAKIYGQDNSAGFINGVLAKVLE